MAGKELPPADITIFKRQMKYGIYLVEFLIVFKELSFSVKKQARAVDINSID